MSAFYRQGCTDGGRRRDLARLLLKTPAAMPRLEQGMDFSTSGKRSGTEQRLSVIIPAQNEERTIGRVILEARQLSPFEIIVVVNGSTDQTEIIARQLGAATIVYEEPLGTDVGRSIGAFAASGESLLFLDSDFYMPWRELVPFCDAVLETCDLAVNRLDHHLGMRMPWNTVTALKVALNAVLGREDLANASLVPVPFAMNRKALEVMHWFTLLCPPKAYALGVLEGLRVEQVHRVEVDRINRFRPHKHNKSGMENSPAAMQIIGDHYEALHAIYRSRNVKGEV
ncbi:glycosyltransferase family 2 protein [Paenibacillus sinopodophylli]|uniref:glycosyltransferase family 2 protein n=1 Tax=Paenibacillus sinopodophylli TaxID=1837342 RepID=UPI00110CDAE4|nr:glycosyltransferase family A protein [Paenibacillus sinopodophylli]